jgi:drug/metabolite transporter (DMT)-like permease
MGNNIILNILVVVVVTAIAIYGDTFLKSATTSTGTKHIFDLGMGVLIYALVAFGFYYMYKLMDFSSSGVIYSLVSVLLYMGVGLFLYKEAINVYEIFGIIFAIASIFLLSRFA